MSSLRSGDDRVLQGGVTVSGGRSRQTEAVPVGDVYNGIELPNTTNTLQSHYEHTGLDP